MFSKILIANRGEIAVRVARTAKRLGVKTVAVYSDADAAAPHVLACDEAMHIGASAPAESYLVTEKILDAAKRTGAEAVHPGYGFLSENAAFSEACDKAGIVFIGPTADTIRKMGSKSAAKDLMEAASVPTTPGYQGEDQSLETFKAEAKRIGYPVLLKATAGGGGKGMRRVDKEADLKDALASAKQEAKSAFGDDRFLIEKYVARARHLEVQIFGDGKGEVVHLYERDCSVQRRHQKIIEEAPAPNLPGAVREKLLEAGVNAGKAVDYRGAGTVEFLYDSESDGVYFMEMNTRLQVEHPVTEMITGVDLVEWQLVVAARGSIPLKQDDIAASGHAFEARLYAEDAANNFAPSTGTLEALLLPEATARIDSGVAQGQTITPFYDPMIAKIITHGPERSSALGRLASALEDTAVTGLETNAAFLHRLATDEAFASGDVSTRYIEDHGDTLFAPGGDMETATLCAFALQQTGGALGFRLNAPASSVVWAGVGDDTLLLELKSAPEGLTLDRTLKASAASRRAGETGEALEQIIFSGCVDPSGDFALTIDGKSHRGRILPHLGGSRVFLNGETLDIAHADPLNPDASGAASEGSLVAPMPGVILDIFVKEGDAVEEGAALVSMEAMKMEHTIKAPVSGVVKSVRFAKGDQVGEGDQLVEIEREES